MRWLRSYQTGRACSHFTARVSSHILERMPERAHPPILALGRSEAAMLMKSRPGGIKIVISICGQSEPPLEIESIPHRLVLHFDDTELVDTTDPLSAHQAWIRRKWAAETGRELRAPNMEDAKAIVEFARQAKDTDGTVLCCCQAGISRSPAAALLCLAAWMGKGHEDTCIDELLRVRPSAMPLLSLVRFGDALLGFDGELVRCVLEARQLGCG